MRSLLVNFVILPTQVRGLLYRMELMASIICRVRR